ncbi:hypothetical protein HYU18_01770 [Candidatus Woesearchaeota archaeon]|nr:hypothetical protein [Candidatus Woesearchaeota archaeon]
MAGSRWVSVLIMAVILLGAAVPLYRLYGPKASHGEGTVVASLEMPDFATKNAKIMKAYQVAVARKDEFKFLTCHCGCGMHAMSHRGKTIPKMDNLADCFQRSDGSWEDHAAIDCPYCVDLAILADEMLSSGSTLREVRELIDEEYNRIAPNMRAMDMNPPMPQ